MYVYVQRCVHVVVHHREENTFAVVVVVHMNTFIPK